jgi:Rieske Fe-S protein
MRKENETMSSTQPPAEARPKRRTFLHWLTYGVGAAAAAMVSIPFIGYLLGPLRKNRTEWVRLGPLTQFPINETRLAKFKNPLSRPWDGIAADTAVYVRNLGPDEKQSERVVVFALNCTHLGCPVTWFPQSGLFMCPCHGGVYYENGDRASGPPPRALFQCVWRIRDGELEIQAPHLPTLHHTLEHSVTA